MTNTCQLTSTAIALALAVLAPASVQAQAAGSAGPDLAGSGAEPEPQTVTVTGLRPEPLARSTGAASILDGQALAVRASPFVADQLRAVPGVAVSRSGASGALTQVRIRGAEANHTLVLLNGVEISDPVGGEIDFGLLSGLPLDRIEVARGEQSVIFGSGAIGGVVALVTGGEPAAMTARAEAGSFETASGSLVAQGRWGGTALLAALSAQSTFGVDTAGLSGEKDGSSATGALVSLARDLPDGWRLSGLGSLRLSRTETDPDADFDGRLENANAVTGSVQWIGGLALEQTGDSRFSQSLRLSATSVLRETAESGVDAGDTLGERVKLAWSPSLRVGGPWAGQDGMRLTAVLDWQSETYRRRGPASFFGDPNQSAQLDTAGLGIEARGQAGPVIWKTSVRQDWNDGAFEDATTWRAGASWLMGSYGRLRASAGTGVKNPTFVELFGFFPGSFIGNPDLRPEASTGWDIGWDGSAGALDWSLGWFEARLGNEIITTFDPVTFFASPANRDGSSRREGLEAAAGWQVNEGVRLAASFTSLSSTSADGRKEIRVPEETGSLSVSWIPSHREGLQVGLAADYVGQQPDIDFATFSTVELDAYWLVSATLEVPLRGGLALTLRGDNLMDAEATDVVGYRTAGRGVYLGLVARTGR
jgi:vitamin B12 transporter